MEWGPGEDLKLISAQVGWLIQRCASVTDLWIAESFTLIDCFGLQKEPFPPSKIGPIYRAAASRGQLFFNLLPLLIRCIAMAGFMSPPHQAAPPFSAGLILQQEMMAERWSWYAVQRGMPRLIPQPRAIASETSACPRLSRKWARQSLLAQMQLILCLSPSAFPSRLLAAHYLLLCTLGLMKFTYKYHADKGMLCKWACFLACSSISPIYVARPGFTFKAGEQTAGLLLIRPCFSSRPLIKSLALFAIQDRGMALLLCSAVTCQFPALPDGGNKAIGGKERDEKWEFPPPSPTSPAFLFTASAF